MCDRNNERRSQRPLDIRRRTAYRLPEPHSWALAYRTHPRSLTCQLPNGPSWRGEPRPNESAARQKERTDDRNLLPSTRPKPFPLWLTFLAARMTSQTKPSGAWRTRILSGPTVGVIAEKGMPASAEDDFAPSTYGAPCSRPAPHAVRPASCRPACRDSDCSIASESRALFDVARGLHDATASPSGRCSHLSNSRR